MSKTYLNENDLVRRGDVILAFENLECIAVRKECPADDLKCQFVGTILTVPPADENTASRNSTKIVLDPDTVQKKMELAEKILELDKRIARLDKSIREIDNGEKKVTCSMVVTCDCVMPFANIEVEDTKSILRCYRNNLRVKMHSLWDEFATINPRKAKE